MQNELGTALIWVFSVQVLALASPGLKEERRSGISMIRGVLQMVLMAIPLVQRDVEWSLLALAGSTGIHAFSVRRTTREGFAFLLLASALILLSAWAHSRLLHDLAWITTGAAIVLRAGVWPFSRSIRSLCETAPREQTRQLATLLPLVFVYLRDLDHLTLATESADLLVMLGSVSTLAAALKTLGAEKLSSFYRGAVVVHGGVLMMGLGAAGKGHYGAALFAALTCTLAVGGLSVMVQALRARSGDVTLKDFGGRARAFPKLTAGFAFFGGAGVGLPGTAGFIADDLLLHALWEESALGTGLAILASAVLAIATWIAVTRIFFGPVRSLLSPDLSFSERLLAFTCASSLVILGVFPDFLLQSLEEVLTSTPLVYP